MHNTLLNWFYGTYFGGLYFEFLLWLDRHLDKPTRYLTPKEMATIVKESSKINDGVLLIKNKVNSLVHTRSKEEYHRVLSEIVDLTDLAEQQNPEVARFNNMLRQFYVKKGSKDINNHTELAKAIEQRIQDTKELWEHQEKRNLLRNIRKASISGDDQALKKLQEEFNNKYGKSNRRS